MSKFSKIASRTSPILTRRFSQFLSKRNSTMGNDKEQQLIKHTVIQTATEIPKFSGEPNTIEINQYIDRIENLISNRGITTEGLKIDCFKEHIDPHKGTARNVATMSDLKVHKTFKEFVTAFKRHFTTKSDRDPIRAMVKFLKTTPEQGEQMTTFISRLDTQAQDLNAIFEKSEWADQTDKSKISIKDMARIMVLSQIVRANKPVVQERLYRDLKANTDLCDVDCLLKGYAEIDPESNTFVLATNTSTNNHPVTATQRQGRSQSRVRSITPYRGRSQSRGRINVECYIYHKIGHLAKDCYANDTCTYCNLKGHNDRVCRKHPWCKYHKRIGHKTVDCRAARNQNFHQGQPDQTDNT